MPSFPSFKYELAIDVKKNKNLKPEKIVLRDETLSPQLLSSEIPFQHFMPSLPSFEIIMPSLPSLNMNLR